MASIRDVAVRAGVGIGTVSRALNGTGYISEDTKKKIMNAVEELGYRPNELAQNLYYNRSGIIGLMVPNLEHPFFASLAKQIQANLYKEGYKCIIGDVEGNLSRQNEFLELLQRNAIDGVITCVDPLDLRDVERIQKPIVVLDRNWGSNSVNVHSDHKKGGEMAARLLMEAGARKILVFRPDCTRTFSFMARYHEFDRILSEYGAEVRYVELQTNTLGYAYDYEEVWKSRELFREVDGIFGGDLNAAASLKIAQEMGIRVPEELKIVGYDGTSFLKFLHPSLTTIAQNIPVLAETLVRAVINRVQGKEVKKEFIVDVSLVRGETI